MPQGRDSPAATSAEHLRQYQDLVETSPDLIWQSDAQGRYTYLNPAWEATFGHRLEDMLGKSLSDFQSPDTGERDTRELTRLMQAGAVKGYETVCIGKSGKPIHLALYARQVCDEHGQVTGARGTAHDITDQSQAAEVLARSAREWQETFDATLDAIWVLDKDHRIVRSNRMAEPMFGRPRGAMIGQHCWQIVHGTAGPIPECPALRARRSLHRESMELQLGHRWVAIHLDPILDRDGNYNGSVHIVSDITERKQAEARLGRTLERLNLATHAIRLGIWDWDIQKNELVWDDRMYELYGIKRADFTGAYAAWLARIHPDDRDASNRASQAALRGECEYDTEFRVLWPDGTVRYLHAYGVITRDPDGRPLRMTGSNYDITARKQAEAALRRSETLFSSAFKMSPAATILSSLQDGMCIDANESYARLVGFSREELLGRTTTELNIWMSPDERNRVVHELSQSGRLHNVPLTLRKKDGALCSTVASGETLVIEGQQCILSFFFDITDRKRAEAALRESEERFRKIVEDAPMAMAVVSMNGVIEFINHKAVQVFGYLPEDIPNMDRWWYQAYPDEVYRKEVVADWTGRIHKALTEGGEIPGREYRVTCKDRTIKTMFISGVPVSDKIFVMFDDITERKQAEEALRQSNDKFSKIFTTSPDAVTISRFSDGTFLEVNQGFVDASGFAREEVLGRSSLPGGVALWTGEADRNQMLDGLNKCGEVIGMEVHMHMKSGAIGTALLSARVVEIANEKCLLIVARDITARKRMEEALQESEQRYRMVSELATDYVYKLSVAADGQVTMDFVSDNFYSLTGRTKADAATVGLWSGIIHPDDLGKALALLRKLVANPQSTEIECRSYVHGRELRWIHIMARSEWDERQQRVTAIVGAVKDISERKRAEEAMAAEKERLAVTLRSIGDGVITTDVTGAIVIMNRVAEELTGWTQNEAAGKPLGSVFSIADEMTREPCESPVERVLATGRRIELANHTLLTSRDGTERVIADSGAPISGTDGKTIGVVLVFRDVTERQKSLETMQRAAKLDSLGVLAGGIAHDFNNLLAGIFGYVELARSVSKEAAAIEYLDAIRATMNRARSLTMQLLTFAKGGAPAQKPTALLPFLQETVQFALSGSSVACRFAFAQDLWSCNIDKHQIAQVIDNVVINAQQAMPNGGCIAVGAGNVLAEEGEYPGLAGGRYVKVSIEDQGVGIPKDVLPHIFDPFYTTKTKGHGLGLATCYSIVSRHGGCIDVESEPGRGSTFHVYLPASAEIVVANAAAVVRQRGRGRVIVADDEEVIRETVRKMLESLGCCVMCARDGREAIDLYVDEKNAGRRVDAMVLDLTIRGGTGGKEAVAELRKLDAELPVFVASGYADDPVMRNPADYGFTGSIGKPFTIEELSDMLKGRSRE